MTREEAKREMMFAKRNVIADSWIDQAYDVAIQALSQPELIQCKDCKHRHEAECPMRHEEDIEWDDDGYIERETIYHDWTEDDGYCDRGERREA